MASLGRLLAACALVVLAATEARANEDPLTEVLGILYDAALEYGNDPRVLNAVCFQESTFSPWAFNVRGKTIFPASLEEALRVLRDNEDAVRDHRLDIGLCQINSWWAKRIADVNGTSFPIEALLDPVLNARVASMILALETEAKGGDVWAGVGRYHSPTPSRASNYTRLVKRFFDDRGGPPVRGVTP